MMRVKCCVFGVGILVVALIGLLMGCFARGPDQFHNKPWIAT